MIDTILTIGTALLAVVVIVSVLRYEAKAERSRPLKPLY